MKARNSFLEDSGEIINLDTQEVMSDEVIHDVRCAKQLGIQQYRVFMKESLLKARTPIGHTIKLNKLKLLG